MVDEQIKQVFKDIFNASDCEQTTSIHSIQGWDSLGHVKLILGLEKKFGLKFPFHEAVKMRDVKTIQDYLTKRGIIKTGY